MLLVSNYARIFDSKRQSRSLLQKQIPKFGLTFLFLLLVIVTLKAFEAAGNISGQKRAAFNIVITILSLLLGLNFFEAFKDMAKVYRWKVLFSGKFSPREADLILGGENLTNLVRLIKESWGNLAIVFACVSWIALNLLAQGAVATINLTYDVDRGTDSNGTILRPESVDVPKLDCYYNAVENCPTVAEVPQVLAHSYGEAVTGQTCCNYTTVADILSNKQDCYYFCRTDEQEYAFRYAEYNPEDTARAYPRFTNRTITASPGKCLEYNFDSDAGEGVPSPDGFGSETSFPYSNDTFTGNITIPNSNSANDATTYIYNGELQPQDAQAYACGPRCLKMFILRTQGPVTTREVKLFECPITVSSVSNAILPQHDISDTNAQLAAASIALTGRYQTRGNPPRITWRQSRLYPRGSPWETDGLSAQVIGGRISQFAIGSLAGMAHLNPTAPLPGIKPMLAYQINVTWWGIIALAAGIAAAHALLVMLMVWISIPIAVLDDSNLVVARLLRTLVGRLGDHGSLLDGKELARAIQREGTTQDPKHVTQAFERDATGKGGVAFGIVRDEAENLFLELSEAAAESKDGFAAQKLA